LRKGHANAVALAGAHLAPLELRLNDGRSFTYISAPSTATRAPALTIIAMMAATTTPYIIATTARSSTSTTSPRSFEPRPDFGLP